MIASALAAAALLITLSMVRTGPALAASTLATDELIARSTLRLERRPADRAALLALGDALARKGRETGDAGHFDRAVEVLRSGTAAHPDDGALWRHLAYALSLRHDFPDAVQAATRAVTLRPDDADTHAVLGDALLELGRYDEAQASYDTMARLEMNLASLSRQSGMASLRGDAVRAIALLEDAVRAGKRDGEPAESIAWAQWQLGMEHFQRGRLRNARRCFQAALALYPDYHRAHAGLGAVAAAQGRLGAAARDYGRAMAVVPLPEYALGLAMTYARQGLAAQAQAQLALVEQLTQLAGGDYPREVAYYFLDRGQHVARILAQSERALLTRPDLQGHQLHAWALHKSNRPAEALEAVTRAMRLGTRDARLLHQAGVIHRAAGLHKRGQALLRAAHLVNPLHARSLALTAPPAGVQGPT